LCAKAYPGSCEMDENPVKQGPHSLTLRLAKGGWEVRCATSSISMYTLMKTSKELGYTYFF